MQPRICLGPLLAEPESTTTIITLNSVPKNEQTEKTNWKSVQNWINFDWIHAFLTLRRQSENELESCHFHFKNPNDSRILSPSFLHEKKSNKLNQTNSFPKTSRENEKGRKRKLSTKKRKRILGFPKCLYSWWSTLIEKGEWILCFIDNVVK